MANIEKALQDQMDDIVSQMVGDKDKMLTKLLSATLLGKKLILVQQQTATPGRIEFQYTFQEGVLDCHKEMEDRLKDRDRIKWFEDNFQDIDVSHTNYGWYISFKVEPKFTVGPWDTFNDAVDEAIKQKEIKSNESTT